MLDFADWAVHFSPIRILVLGIALALAGLMLDWYGGRVRARSTERTQDALRLGLLAQTLQTLETQRPVDGSSARITGWIQRVEDARRQVLSAAELDAARAAPCATPAATPPTSTPAESAPSEARIADYRCALRALHEGVRADGRQTPSDGPALGRARALATGLQWAQLNTAVHERRSADAFELWYRILFVLGIPLIIANKVSRASLRRASR